MLSNFTGADVIFLLAIIGASAVEVVEAMTIVLASGLTRGWRSSLVGAGAAVVLLAVLVIGFGSALAALATKNIEILRLVVGTFLLIFGLQWLRKAILRASGYKSLRDEAALFQAETAMLEKAGKKGGGGIDGMGFTISFKGVFLEGTEVIAIVISVGAAQQKLGLASLGAGIAIVAVSAVGFFLAKPLAAIPENSMKLVVGTMIVTFGTFWGGEGAGVAWPMSDAFILVLLCFYALVTYMAIAVLKRLRVASMKAVKA